MTCWEQVGVKRWSRNEGSGPRHFASKPQAHIAQSWENSALPRLRIATRTGVNNMSAKNLLPFVLFPTEKGCACEYDEIVRMHSARLTKDTTRGCRRSPFPLVSHEAKQATSLKTLLQVFPFTDQDKFWCDIGSPSFKACIKSERSTTFGNVSPDGLQPCGTLRYCFSLNPKVCSLDLCEDSLCVWKCTALGAGFLFHRPR